MIYILYIYIYSTIFLALVFFLGFFFFCLCLPNFNSFLFKYSVIFLVFFPFKFDLSVFLVHLSYL